MADVFLSYSQKDRAKAQELASRLEAAGITVWWDNYLETGEHYTQEIARQIQMARAVVVLWTLNSVQSTYVDAEAKHARDHEKIVPVRLAPLPYEDIPPPYNTLHTVDFDNFGELAKTVERTISAEKSSGYRFRQVRFHSTLFATALVSGLSSFGSLMSVVKVADFFSVFVSYYRAVAEVLANLIQVPRQVVVFVFPFVFLLGVFAVSVRGAQFDGVDYRASRGTAFASIGKKMLIGFLVTLLFFAGAVLLFLTAEIFELHDESVLVAALSVHMGVVFLTCASLMAWAAFGSWTFRNLVFSILYLLPPVAFVSIFLIPLAQEEYEASFVDKAGPFFVVVTFIFLFSWACLGLMQTRYNVNIMKRMYLVLAIVGALWAVNMAAVEIEKARADSASVSGGSALTLASDGRN